MKNFLIELIKNIFSTYYYAHYSWKKGDSGNSFRLYRIPFWKSLTIQVHESIQELEASGKETVYLESVVKI